MSTFRKTVLTTAIIGAGLASTSGAAFASDGHHGHQESNKSSAACSNLTEAVNDNGGEVAFGIISGGNQGLSSTNICNNLNGNSVGSGNNLAGGNIQNGSNTVKSNSTTTASTTGKNSPATILTGLLG